MMFVDRSTTSFIYKIIVDGTKTKLRVHHFVPNAAFTLEDCMKVIDGWNVNSKIYCKGRYQYIFIGINFGDKETEQTLNIFSD